MILNHIFGTIFGSVFPFFFSFFIFFFIILWGTFEGSPAAEDNFRTIFVLECIMSCAKQLF